MASCKPFTVTFEGSSEELFNKIRDEIINAGGEISNNPSVGSFHISAIEGNYSIITQQITIEITHRPFIISCERIEDEVRERLQGFVM